MEIKACPHCDGCGYVVGHPLFEIALAKWAGSQKELDEDPIVRLFRPRVCPVCDGGGTVVDRCAGPCREHSYSVIAELV